VAVSLEWKKVHHFYCWSITILVKIKENGIDKPVVCVGDRNICADVFWKPEDGKLTGGFRFVLLINMKRDLKLRVCDDTSCFCVAHRKFL
jgi:hypothetical protein